MRKIKVRPYLPFNFSSSMWYDLPVTGKFKELTIAEGFSCITEEFCEAGEAHKIYRSCLKEDIKPEDAEIVEQIKGVTKTDYALELMDIIFACNSQLALLGYTPAGRRGIAKKVLNKNKKRGYYDD